MARYRVKVFETAIGSLFAPGGDAWDFGTKVRAEIIAKSKQPGFVPRRSGALAAGTVDGGQLKSGRYGCRGYIGNNVEHALWVHEGTRPVITPNSARHLKVPIRRSIVSGAASPRGSVFFPKSVHGQKANPWLDRAALAVLSKYL